MKRTTLFASLFLTTLIAAAPLAANEAQPETPAVETGAAPSADSITLEPALKFEYETFDYGTLDQGEKVTIDFPFKNTSDRTITIESIRASCGCTTSVLEKKVYAPGEGEVIKATFDSTRRQGQNNKTITVTTDDAAQAQYKLTFTGVVEVSLFMEEPVFQIMDLDQGTKFEGTTHIINFSGNPVEFTNVAPSKEGVLVTLGEPEAYTDAKTKRVGERIPLNIVIPETMGAGPLDGSIEITTNNSNVSRLSLPVRGQILGDLIANPPQVFFGNPIANTESKRRVVLSAKKGNKFVLESTDLKITQGDGVPTISVEEVEAPVGRPNSQAVDITLVAPKEAGYLVGDLTLIGKLGDKPHSLVIPIKLLVRPEAGSPEQSTSSSGTPITPEARDAKIREMQEEVKKQIAKERAEKAQQAANAPATTP